MPSSGALSLQAGDNFIKLSQAKKYETILFTKEKPVYLSSAGDFGWLYLAALLFLFFTKRGTLILGKTIGRLFGPTTADDLKIMGTMQEPIDEENEFKTNTSSPPVQLTTEPCLIYEGHHLNFSEAEYIHALSKRNFFYKNLHSANKQKFITRVNEFIRHKRFIIHAKSGFKEMPVLLSGTAVQLTFGLEEYLLPCFHEIHIYPDAFIGLNPLRVLIGNVSGNSINISWKHFLEGAEIPDDNSHVGLHEMAHALYYQNMIDTMHADEDFANTFPLANKVFDEVFNIEKNTDGIYSEYATKNFQEFWAESVEIFFENPAKLKTRYPKLYHAICGILNLNPLSPANPLIVILL